jgi:hypothetical protein
MHAHVLPWMLQTKPMEVGVASKQHLRWGLGGTVYNSLSQTCFPVCLVPVAVLALELAVLGWACSAVEERRR